MKILITGGAGFIGSNFLYYYLNKYPERKVLCLDSMTYAANPKTLAKGNNYKNFSFVQGDICDYSLIDQIFEEHRFDLVINFAAESHVDRSIDDPELFLKTNILGTRSLMDASRKYGVKRFHQVSTDEVYGDLPLDRPDLLFTEDSPLQASSPYAASKAAADLLVLSYFRTFNFPATISRCSNNYGPYQHIEKLIPLMIVRAMENLNLPIYGNGLNVRDWLHVEDHCSALDGILENGQAGQIYNIGGNSERANIDIVKTILHSLGKSESLINYVEDRPGHDLRYAIDAGKMKKELGWEPKIALEQGIEQTTTWYLSNKDWWENLRPYRI